MNRMDTNRFYKTLFKTVRLKKSRYLATNEIVSLSLKLRLNNSNFIMSVSEEKGISTPFCIQSRTYGGSSIFCQAFILLCRLLG